MADASLTFKPADIATASDAASKAMSKINAGSAVWDLDASAAVSAVAARSAAWDSAASKCSDAISAASHATVSAAAALSKVNSLASTVIRTNDTGSSAAVHYITRTSAGLLKFMYSTVL